MLVLRPAQTSNPVRAEFFSSVGEWRHDWTAETLADVSAEAQV
jgi:hypothetical protein